MVSFSFNILLLPAQEEKGGFSSPIMETPKPRSGSSDAPKKVSPRVARQLKLNPVGFGSSSPASPSTTSTRTPKDKSPKIPERKSPRSPVIPERKRPSRVTEFETQISELQEDLKKVKKELTASKASKKEAEAIAEGLQQQLSEVSSKLEDSQKQLAELRASKEADVAELKDISEEKDQAWETQLDIIHKQHSIDASALASALEEIQTLKKQLEMVTKCEDDDIELQGLKLSLSETLLVLENMKTEMECCKESEALAQGLVQETLVQLEEAKQAVNSLRNDGMKTMEDYNSVASELEESRARVAVLEGMVNKAEAHESEIVSEDHQNVVDELMNLRSEVGKLKSTIEELKANLMDKETELQFISEENECLNLKLGKSSANQEGEDKSEDDLKRVREEVVNLKANLMDKETELQNIKEENEILKSELGCPESSRAAAGEDTLEGMKEEADKNKRRAERAAEQLEVAQAANAELEAELRRLKVQSDQWRKAAEAAASMLSSPVGNGRLVQRTDSLDNPSPYLDDYDVDEEDDDEDAFKKKNGNVLRKIGGFWKKPQK